MSTEVNRRAALGALGAMVATSVVTGSEADAAVTPTAKLEDSKDLIAPLTNGSRIGAWRVERVIPPADGALSLVLSDRSGRLFQLDICARDMALDAPRSPAASVHFEIFVANGGDGATGTIEDHGLAAMALGEVIRTNEARVSRAGFATLRERVARSAARLHTAETG